MKRIDGYFSADYILVDDMDVGLRDSIQERQKTHLKSHFKGYRYDSIVYDTIEEAVFDRLYDILFELRDLLQSEDLLE